jgi:chromosome segregation ATPase
MRTALNRKRANSESPDMTPSDNAELLAQVAELRADVRHAQGDITDIKSDVRELNNKFDKIQDGLHSAQLWAFGLYIALAGTLLYVIARAAKWI